MWIHTPDISPGSGTQRSVLTCLEGVIQHYLRRGGCIIGALSLSLSSLSLLLRISVEHSLSYVPTALCDLGSLSFSQDRSYLITEYLQSQLPPWAYDILIPVAAKVSR